MIRRMGIVLFAVYVILLIYFLFCGNQKVLGIPGTAGRICGIYQYFRKCDRLPTFRVYPSGYFQKNEQWFSYLHIRIYIKSDSRSDPACHEGRMF